MSDIVDRLRTEGAMKDYYNVPALQREAADEIERLRALVDQCDHHEHSLQEAQRAITQLRGKLETQSEAYTRLAAENRKLRGEAAS